jgi:hypothetical protein
MRSILLLLQLILFVGAAVLPYEAGDPESKPGRPPASASRTSLKPPAATGAAPAPHAAAVTPAHSSHRVPRPAL